MKTVYFDCFGGATAEILLAALMDAGVSLERLNSELGALPSQPLTLEKLQVRGIQATRVRLPQGGPVRQMRDIAALTLKGNFPQALQERILRIFHRLAVAEGKIRGKQPDQICFEEGDRLLLLVAGTCLALQELGITSITSAAVPLGRGRVMTPQGVIPLPRPAVIELLKDIPTCDTGEEGEAIDPAGAAILATLSKGFGRIPALTISDQGYGTDEKGRLLRVVLGQVADEPSTEPVGVLETNLEDTAPQFYERVLEKLLEAGALDVFLSPVTMKGGTPGVKLSALVPLDRQQACTQVIFEETSSIGIRYYQAERHVLNREIMSIQTEYGPIRVKVARQMGAIVNIMPEYSDCLAAAKNRGLPLKRVWQSAFAGAFQQGQLIP